MNRGNIPGFYYDEEKKKYFNITANHVAPADAKYSQTNVKREERDKKQAKKRKLADRLTRKQTVNQAAPLKSRLLSTTLQREIGNRTIGHLRASRDEAITSNLEDGRLIPRIQGFHTPPAITDAHYVVNQSRMLLAASHSGAGASCVYSYEWEDSINGMQSLKEQRPLVALPGRFITMQHFDSTLLLVSNTTHAIQYYLGPSNPAENPQSTLFPSANVENFAGETHACAYDSLTQNLAIVGTGLLVVNGAIPGHIGRCDFGETMESFAVTWLQPSVLAYGLTAELQYRSGHHIIGHNPAMASHSVCLWDVRIGNRPNAANSSTRLSRRQRVTGLERLQVNDHHLLVTDNRSLNLYDLRMQSTHGPPLLAIAHSSVGAQLDFAVQGDLIAAIDEMSRVQVYSLSTSRHLRSLTRNQSAWSHAPPLRQLRWQENRNGSPYLQACADSIVHKWSW